MPRGYPKPAGPAYRDWRVATALSEARGTKRYGFGEYRAQNYDELVDHPVTLGEFALATFKAHRRAARHRDRGPYRVRSIWSVSQAI